MNTSQESGITCSECGSHNAAGAAFCGQCGDPLPDLNPVHSWVISIPMLNNRFMLYDLAKLLFWTAIVMASVMLVMLAIFGERHDFWKDYFNILRLFAYVLAGFAVMFLAIMLVFFGNRYRMGFTINRSGVGWTMLMSRARWANRAAVVAGLLAGKPGVAGAGLLAQAQEQGIIAWDEIRKLKFYPALCSISVMNGWRVVIRLNCTPENYKAVAEILKSKAKHAAVQTLAVLLALLLPALGLHAAARHCLPGTGKGASTPSAQTETGVVSSCVTILQRGAQ